eukprot:gene10591-12324_t
MAKAGQMNSAKIMAKDLVRTRFHVQKFYEMKTQLQAVSLRIQTLQSTQSMAEAMKGVTKAMMVMNKQMNIPQFTKIMMEFEMQSDKMDMKEEMMNDTMDDIMTQDSEEEQSQEILNQVLDEIGIDLASQLVDAPQSSAQSVASKKPSANIINTKICLEDSTMSAWELKGRVTVVRLFF